MLLRPEVPESTEAPEAGSPVRWRHSAALLLVMIAAGTWLYVMRRPIGIASPAFWAEDATVFFKGAVQLGPLSLFESYQGQVLLFQRVIALLTAPLPTIWQPALYAIAATTAAVGSSAIVLSSRWRYPVPVSWRFACMLALLCSPAVDEVYATLSNSHWWLAIGLLLIGFLADPISRRLRAGELAFASVTSLSGFAAVYALPILAVRSYRNRSRHSAALLGVAVAGTCVQAGVLMVSDRETGVYPLASHPATEVIALIRRLLAGAAIGDNGLAQAWPHRIPDLWVWLIPVALAAVLLVMWMGLARLEMAALAVAVFGGCALLLWAFTPPLESLWRPIIAGRYLVVPTAAVYIGLIVRRPRRGMQIAALSVACALLATGVASDYHLDPWTSGDWAQFSHCMEEAVGPTCSVGIAPNWTLEMVPTGR